MSEYSFSDFLNECLHPEAFGRIPVANRVQVPAENLIPEEETTDSLFRTAQTVVYDKAEDTLKVDSQNDELYEFQRFFIGGPVVKTSADKVRTLSPYFIKIWLNPRSVKTDDSFRSHLTESIKKETAWMKKMSKDISASLMNADDYKIINEIPEVFIGHLETVSPYAMLDKTVSQIMLQDNIIYLDEKNVPQILLSGFWPSYGMNTQPLDFTAEAAA